MKNLLFYLLLTALLFTTGCLKKTLTKIGEIDPAIKIQAIYPTLDCPVEESRPIFSWTALKTTKSDVKYQFVLVQVEDQQDAKTAIEKNEKLAKEDGIDVTSIEMPAIVSDLRPNTVYAFRVSAYGEADKKIIGKSDVSLFYTLDNKMPDYFQKLICCENNLIEKSVTSWKKAYGNPEVNEQATGCFTNQGTIQLTGNRIDGDGIYQVLDSKIKKGNYYQISFCAKPFPKETSYVRFRFLAYNGQLPTNGSHPEITASKAVIGESGDIESEGWNRYFLSSWKAPKDYEKVAVFVVTNEHTIGGAHAIGSISNICLQKTSDCGLTAKDIGFLENGIVAEDVKDFVKTGTEPEAIDINFDQGKVVDLFGKPFNEASKSNWYSLENECISVGGEIPPEAVEALKKYTEFKLPGDISIKTFNEGMDIYFEKYGKKMDFPDWGTIPEEKENDCRSEYDKSKPFNGRDIIYVHGLVLDHILKRTIANDQTGFLRAVALSNSFTNNEELLGVSKDWPDDKEAFFDDGFYHKNANDYWDDHISEFLGDPLNPSNRYLLVGFNSSQRLIENVHTVLTQISEAMNEGKGVVYGNDPRGTDCFGNDLVIISHSTGGLLMDVTLAIAQISEENEDIQNTFGDIKYIADRTKVHIALHGALAGSELAGLAVFGANTAAVAATGAAIGIDLNIAVDNAIETGHQIVFDAVTGMNTATTTNNTDVVEAFFDEATDSLVILASNLATTFNNSVLVDLSPPVAKLIWGVYINFIETPVLTVAGGHPIGVNETIFTKILLPGFDDGVVSTNSQSGSPSLLLPEIYSYIPPKERIFDKGIDIQRSIPYFTEQSKELGAAYGSVPWLSPAGMVQPVLTFLAPSPRYSKHYPFLQSTSEHMHSFFGTLDYNQTFGATNFEECLVIENNFVFDNELVNPAIANLVVRNVRGQDLVIAFSIPYPVFDFFPPPPTLNWQHYNFEITIPVWRRTYDTLSGNNQETNYVYNFVLR